MKGISEEVKVKKADRYLFFDSHSGQSWKIKISSMFIYPKLDTLRPTKKITSREKKYLIKIEHLSFFLKNILDE